MKHLRGEEAGGGGGVLVVPKGLCCQSLGMQILIDLMGVGGTGGKDIAPWSEVEAHNKPLGCFGFPDFSHGGQWLLIFSWVRGLTCLELQRSVECQMVSF